jgi:hypothetical protein
MKKVVFIALLIVALLIFVASQSFKSSDSFKFNLNYLNANEPKNTQYTIDSSMNISRLSDNGGVSNLGKLVQLSNNVPVYYFKITTNEQSYLVMKYTGAGDADYISIGREEQTYKDDSMNTLLVGYVRKGYTVVPIPIKEEHLWNRVSQISIALKNQKLNAGFYIDEEFDPPLLIN